MTSPIVRRAVGMGMFSPRISCTIPQNLLLTAPTLFEGFENKADWATGGGPTLTDDAVTYVSGTKSLHVVTASGVNGICTKTINLDLSASNGNFRLYVYFANSTDFGANGGITLYLSSSTGFAKYFSCTPNGFHTGWNVVNLRTGDWSNSGGESWANVMVRMRLTVTALASQVATVNLDRYELGGSTKPAVLISFDDVNSSLYTYGYPYMRSKGMVGTLYAVSDLIGTTNVMTAAQYQECYARGWDVGNHTKTHADLTTLSQADAQTEMTACKTVLDGLGLTRASAHLAYPGGQKNDTVFAAAAAAGMLSGRTVSVATTLMAPITRLVMPAVEYRALPTFNVDSTYSLATVEGWVDRAILRGEVLTLLFHQLVTSAAGTSQWLVSDFQALMNYIQAAGMQTLAISELYALQSGPIAVHHK